MEIDQEVMKKFHRFGNKVLIGHDVSFTGLPRISIGNGVRISRYSIITVHPDFSNYDLDWNICLHNEVKISSQCTIEAFNQVEIGEYVIVGPRVYISDSSHNYQDFDVPIQYQGIKKSNSKVLIKDGSWIGTSVSIVGNVTVGYGSVIAANSVVLKEVPDHCMIVGNPARIIKICDYRTGAWIDVSANPKLASNVLANRGLFKGYVGERFNSLRDGLLERDGLNQGDELSAIVDQILKIKELLITGRDILNKGQIRESFPLLTKLVEEVVCLENVLMNQPLYSSSIDMNRINSILKRLVESCECSSCDGAIAAVGELISLYDETAIIEKKR